MCCNAVTYSGCKRRLYDAHSGGWSRAGATCDKRPGMAWTSLELPECSCANNTPPQLLSARQQAQQMSQIAADGILALELGLQLLQEAMGICGALREEIIDDSILDTMRGRVFEHQVI